MSIFSLPNSSLLHRPSTTPSTANTEAREMASAVKDWIKTDETAKEMLTGIFTVRPFLPLPPPLHKLPLRAGNVVEIIGPSSSAKTHILMQVIIAQNVSPLSIFTTNCPRNCQTVHVDYQIEQVCSF